MYYVTTILKSFKQTEQVKRNKIHLRKSSSVFQHFYLILIAHPKDFEKAKWSTDTNFYWQCW